MSYPVFASGDVLNASDMNAVGMWLITTQNITAGTNLQTISNCFSSTYKNYKIVFSEVDMVNADDGIQVYFEATAPASNYFSRQQYSKYDGTANAFNSTNNGGYWWTGLGGTESNTHLIMDISNPNLAKYTTFSCQWQSDNYAGWAGGQVKTTTQYTSIRFKAGGNFNSGSIQVYGYRL